MKILLLNLLLFIPIVGFYLVKLNCCKFNYIFLGVIIGSIISPLTLGLYSIAFTLPYIGFIFLIFLPLNLFFTKPAWWILVEKSNLINGTDLSIYDHFYLALLNGFIWAIVFGFIGFFFEIKNQNPLK